MPATSIFKEINNATGLVGSKKVPSRTVSQTGVKNHVKIRDLDGFIPAEPLDMPI